MLCCYTVDAEQNYRSLAKKGPWAVHITWCSDMEVGGYL